MQLLQIAQNYFKTSWVELKKVVWPTGEQTVRYSLIVIGLSIATAIFFGILDYAFNFGLEKFIIR
ncbi:MAG: preprotein translocase subunit SecE [Candidatus Magasanikbacteria bacterium]|nr:preprotein translocase subunit SecE [Candidatus Magasanikbacteria bacterium]